MHHGKIRKILFGIIPLIRNYSSDQSMLILLGNSPSNYTITKNYGIYNVNNKGLDQNMLKCIATYWMLFFFQQQDIDIFLISPRHVVTHQKHLSKALLISTYNIRFLGEIRKKIIWKLYPELCKLTSGFAIHKSFEDRFSYGQRDGSHRMWLNPLHCASVFPTRQADEKLFFHLNNQIQLDYGLGRTLWPQHSLHVPVNK